MSDKLEKYAVLREEHPDWTTAQFAEALGVSTSTIRRWNKKLAQEPPSLEEVEARLRKELEAQFEERLEAALKAREEELERQREEERRRREAEIDRRIQDRERYFKRLLDESGSVTVITDRDEDIGWQGFFFHIPANTPTEVPGIIAGELEQARKRRQAVQDLIKAYSLEERSKHL